MSEIVVTLELGVGTSLGLGKNDLARIGDV